MSKKEYQKIRGKEISMIFQEPMSSLNPTMKCGDQISEIIINHEKISKKISILRLPYNCGHQIAISIGLKFAVKNFPVKTIFKP